MQERAVAKLPTAGDVPHEPRGGHPQDQAAGARQLSHLSSERPRSSAPRGHRRVLELPPCHQRY